MEANIVQRNFQWRQILSKEISNGGKYCPEAKIVQRKILSGSNHVSKAVTLTLIWLAELETLILAFFCILMVCC